MYITLVNFFFWFCILVADIEEDAMQLCHARLLDISYIIISFGYILSRVAQ